jgi:hypothetical protein
MLGVKTDGHEVFVPIDYPQDLGDNLDVLMNDKIARVVPL